MEQAGRTDSRVVLDWDGSPVFWSVSPASIYGIIYSSRESKTFESLCSARFQPPHNCNTE